MTQLNSRTLDKALDLLLALGADQGRRPFAQVADDVGLPFSTARRFGAVLESRGLIIRQQAGRYLPGPALLEIGEAMPRRRVFADLVRPILSLLSRQTGMTAHLGVLEDQMVTYVCKAGEGVFTREGMQLEAYCSGVGKVLLASLADADLEQYLAAGALVALTPRTIIDPAHLREELAEVRRQGWAMEDGEVIEGLACLAIPLRDRKGHVWAAVSISGSQQRFNPRARTRHLLQLAKAAEAVSALPVTLCPADAATAA